MILLSLVVLVLLSLHLILKFRQWYFFKSNKIKFPGPKTYPFIGGAYFVLGSSEKSFLSIRKTIQTYGDIVKMWLSYIPAVIILSPEDIEMVVSNTINNTKSVVYDPIHPWLGTGLLTSTGLKWQNRRKLLTPTFHFSILRQAFKIFNEQANCLTKKLSTKILNEENEIDVIPLVSTFTLHTICETAMGIKLTENESNRRYKQNVLEMTEQVTYRITHPWLIPQFMFMLTRSYWKHKKLTKYLHNFSNNVISQRKKLLNESDVNEIENDLGERRKLSMLDMLLTAKINGANIDEDGIREEVDTFIFEGHDTTSVSISFTLMLLACNEHCQKGIIEELDAIFGDSDRDLTIEDIQELKYTERCIKESLRLYPSVPLISRIAGTDIKSYKGHIIPKGCTIIIFIYDLHRRADLYPDPEKFDPDRFLPENCATRHPFAYIPFSAGSRNCIGQKFAMMELKVLIATVLRKFVLKPVDTPETITLLTDMVLRPKGSIKVKFIPRNRKTL